MIVLLLLARVVLVVALASVLLNSVLLACSELTGELPSGVEVLVLSVACVWGALRLTRGVRRHLTVDESTNAS